VTVAGWIKLMSVINMLGGWENREPGEYLPPEAFSKTGREHLMTVDDENEPGSQVASCSAFKLSTGSLGCTSGVLTVGSDAAVNTNTQTSR
jgi:hypothetical protein